MAEEAVEPPRVKICGLCRREDVLHADAAGADWLGFIATDGYGRSVGETALATLAEGVRAVPVAVLVDETVEEAARRARLLGAGALQLHGDEAPEVVRRLRDEGPWEIWKALRLRSPEELEPAVERYGAVADGLLVEGWKEGVRGGGGAGVDPAWSERIRAALPSSVRYVLAGGLTADTVYSAVARFRPDAVDVSSGVESSRCRKDPESVTRFIQEARRAFGPDPQPPTRHPGASL